MNKAIISALFLIFFQYAHAQVISDSMRVDWTGAGYGACLPNPSRVLNILDFGGSNDSLTDNLAAVNRAIDSLYGNSGVVYFPKGIYRLSSEIAIPSGAILRGAGADSTTLKMKHAGYGFSFTGTAAMAFTNILSGYKKGSVRIRVASGSGLAAGDFAEILETNGSWDLNPATWATNVVGQVVKINAVMGDTIVLEKALRISYDSLLNPRIRKIFPVINAGIESLKIFRDDTSRTSSSYSISFEKAAYCWLKGVESYFSHGSHCMISLSTNIQVSGCYFHYANNYDGGGTRGYGVTLNTHAGQCLIENNIFRHLRHAMMTKCGANGNVFAYNYSVDPFRNGSGEIPANGCGDISVHGHYSYANLFESNVVQTIYIDQTWGPAGPFNTFFRNRTCLYGILCTSSATKKQNFVGNEIINSGMYSLAGAGHFQYGNMFNGSVTPVGTDVLTDSSYFYSSRPALWDQPYWNYIGIPYQPNTIKIPAQRRDEALHFTSGLLPEADYQYIINPGMVDFQNYSANYNNCLWDFGDGATSSLQNPLHLYADTGQYIVCLTAGNGCFSDSVCKTIRISTNSLSDKEHKTRVYPNPVYNQTTVEFVNPPCGQMNLSVFDMNGRCIYNLMQQNVPSRISLDVSGLPEGIYQCLIQADNYVEHIKLIKVKAR